MDQLQVKVDIFSKCLFIYMVRVIISFGFLFVCLKALAETTSEKIPEIEDFINKTIIIHEQAVPSGKEDK